MCLLSSQSVLLYREVSQFMGSLSWASRSHPTGMTTREAPTTTLLFTRSDRLVCSPPCQSVPIVLAALLRQWQDLLFLTSGIVIRPFQADYTIFSVTSTQGCCVTWGFPDFGCLDLLRPEAPRQCTEAQGGTIGPPTLGLSMTGPPCYYCYRQYHWCSLYQQTRSDLFSHPVAAGSVSDSMATVSRYSHPGRIHSRLPQCDSRQAKPAHHD